MLNNYAMSMQIETFCSSIKWLLAPSKIDNIYLRIESFLLPANTLIRILMTGNFHPNRCLFSICNCTIVWALVEYWFRWMGASALFRSPFAMICSKSSMLKIFISTKPGMIAPITYSVNTLESPNHYLSESHLILEEIYQIQQEDQQSAHYISHNSCI